MPITTAPELVSRLAGRQQNHLQDLGKLRELDSHELLRPQASDTASKYHGETRNGHSSFDEVRSIGSWFLRQRYPTVLPSTQPLSSELFSSVTSQDDVVYMGKLALGKSADAHFPVTFHVIQTPRGTDLKLYIVPIDFAALEVAQFQQHTDSLLALAAAAAVAPQFVLALEGGVATPHCSTKQATITGLTADHGTPLAVPFDFFSCKSSTLDTAVMVTGNQNISIKQAAHLHGQPAPAATAISVSAAQSKVAAGVSIHESLRSTLPKHALYIATTTDQHSGKVRAVPLYESVVGSGVLPSELSFLAAALGFTAHVVGNSPRERLFERVFDPRNADTPLQEVVQHVAR